MDVERVPEVGEFITMGDCETLYLAIQSHQEKFPGTPPIMSFSLIMMNYGNRFAPVMCIEQEWQGLAKDVAMTEPGVDPKCPNGHGLEKGDPLKLAWLN